jgi:hypothetical protein
LKKSAESFQSSAQAEKNFQSVRRPLRDSPFFAIGEGANYPSGYDL